MTYSAPQAGAQISRLDSTAILKEIGERLRVWLDQGAIEAPPHLVSLMERLDNEPVRIQRNLCA
jgi:hypothetical protein